ncbi:3-oxoacyl-(acyl-carrier-protein) reductase FabG [Lasiodiplodia hormozganensis]|uniref:3-oxoacyl-(Acyl-carrier-protein) reductase FabG n=1 Tax=Lasiodiplodia hormozganensis TaxID=869390 RepID=A0AA40D6Q3_9PEZI|nr:3-oxoacyl-(acyl-carrier-protein) reductase FabG [Lasiodiplodia hormozganensis]
MSSLPGRLLDKVAIVTGSSSGLGRAIALRYAAEGAKVFCADLEPSSRSAEEKPTTHELIKERGGKAEFHKVDVSDAQGMKELVNEAVKTFGRLDIMVNNAGVSFEAKTPAVLHLTEDRVWDDTMRINSRSVFLGCKHAITQMLQQEPHQSGDRGWIVNISSIMALISGPKNRKWHLITQNIAYTAMLFALDTYRQQSSERQLQI